MRLVFLDSGPLGLLAAGDDEPPKPSKPEGPRRPK